MFIFRLDVLAISLMMAFVLILLPLIAVNIHQLNDFKREYLKYVYVFKRRKEENGRSPFGGDTSSTRKIWRN